MTARLVFLAGAVLLGSGWLAWTGDHRADITVGQVYGSVAFLNRSPSGAMTESPYTIIGFASDGGNRTLVLTDRLGDYIAVLEPGRYCISAYTRKGKPLRVGKSQVMCVDVQVGKDLRLDVMLAPPGQ
jgi:hypothetical protein